MIRKILIPTILLFSTGNILALDSINPVSIGLDVSATAEFPSVKQPTQIIIFPMEIPNNGLKISSEEFYKGIFHYTTKRLGFPDIPFHYVVTSDGIVYATSSNDERSIAVEDIDSPSILIAYLNLDKSTEFSNKAQRRLEELLLEVGNKNGISPDKTFVKNLSFERKVSSSEISIKTKDIFGLWNRSLESITNKIKVNYSPRSREFSAEITNTALSKQEVPAGEEFTFTLNIKNNGPDILYGDTESSLFAARVGSTTSQFYVNGSWIGQSEFALMTDTDIMKVGDVQQFTVKLKAPLFIGDISEEFELKTYNNEKINNNRFTISVKVINASQRIVEIQNSEAGFARVRAAPSTVAEEISRVSSGERFFVLEEDPSGFLKIDLGGGRNGWIAGWLTNSI